MNKFDSYTGVVKYKDIEFDFVFDGKKLKLIPPKDKKEIVRKWIFHFLGNNVYAFPGDPIYIGEYLYGNVNETKQKIIFIPSNEAVDSIDTLLIVEIDYYILFNYNCEKFVKIAISGPEITHIYPTTEAFEKMEYTKDGNFIFNTKSFSKTTTKKEIFNIDNQEISIYFGISSIGSYRTGEAPIILNSTMFLEFKITNDYKFILDLLKLSNLFIQYLCYRKNIVFTDINVYGFVDDKILKVATIFEVNTNNIIEEYPIQKERLIKYKYIKGNIGNILNAMSKSKIYLKHIPDTYENGMCINAARFILITAGVEWEFKNNDLIELKSSKTKEAEDYIEELIKKLIDDNSGKKKEILKFLKKSIKIYNLESKIISCCKYYSDISDVFGKRLYELNNEIFDYKKIGNRVSTQRNNYAHGKIDQNFIGASLIDIIYLEYMIYIMQLKHYGLNNKNIQLSIKELFGCDVIIK